MAARRPIAACGFLLAALLGGTGEARADAIDGNWCFRDGRSFSIVGPLIVTPGGRRIAGDYGRHSFSYVVPASEPGEGGTVAMNLRDEDTIELVLATGDARGPVEIWKRCAGTVS